MINIREIDYDSDISEIVKLIQKNLDENFSEEFFIWKHYKNPFGKSLGLLALDDTTIIGVRMFMRWEFQLETGEIVKAIRPVDTVTDLNYRGQGLFKKLTLGGLEKFKDEYQVIFNTPNTNSFGGYLKMGWEKFNHNSHFYVAVLNPFLKKIKFDLIESKEINTIQSKHSPSGTNKTIDFLRWRYKDPKYRIAKFADETLVVYKTFKYKSLPAIMIFNTISKKRAQAFYANSIAKFHTSFFIYYLSADGNKKSNFIHSFKGDSPVITVKSDKLNKMSSINFSLGDVESIM